MKNLNSSVLLVEDDVDISETLKLILESEGYTVVSCFNGKAALDWLEQTQKYPFLILLDVMMPVMNGYEFLERKSKLSSPLQKIPVVILSAMSHTSVSSHDVQALLKKPVDIHLLLNTIKKFLPQSETEMKGFI